MRRINKDQQVDACHSATGRVVSTDLYTYFSLVEGGKGGVNLNRLIYTYIEIYLRNMNKQDIQAEIKYYEMMILQDPEGKPLYEAELRKLRRMYEVKN